MFDNIFEQFKENFMNMITSRLLVLVFVLFGARPFMYQTSLELQKEVVKIAKEIFK